MLVHGMFNASVPVDKRLRRLGVAVDDSVPFVLLSTHDARGLLALQGIAVKK